MRGLIHMNIVVVGTGHIGPRHAKSVVGCEDTNLLCIVDPAPQAKLVAESFNVPLFSSIQQMLDSELKADAAIVCTPNKSHVSVSKELLAAGIHVLVEKPISTTISDGHDLLLAAKSNDTLLLVGHHRRFNPFATATKQALEDGLIGRPIAVTGMWATCKPPTYFEAPAEWRATAESGKQFNDREKIPYTDRTSEGGPILINMIHDVDLLQYFLGPIIRVHAEQTVSQRRHEAEEGAAILFRFASGVVGTFIISDATPSSHTWEAATGENPIFPKVGKDAYRIFGTEGVLSVGDMVISKHSQGDEKSWRNQLEEHTLDVGNEIPFDEQIKHLVRVMRGEERPRCTGEDGLSALIVCDAIKRALKDGVAIDIESP